MKTNYLQAMGIVPWRLRNQPALPIQTSCYHLFDAQGRDCGMMMAKIATTAEQELFQAMLQALNLKTEPGVWATTSRCIFLGVDCGAEYPLQGVPTITTHSLAEMLDNPLLKAKVWKDLQHPHLGPLLQGERGK